VVAVRVERHRFTKKASDIQILPILYYALEFSISMHGRVFVFKSKVYMLCLDPSSV
jgi:hypothetical protein